MREGDMKFICMHCYLSPADKKEGEDAVPLDDEDGFAR